MKWSSTPTPPPPEQNLIISYDGEYFIGCKPWAKGVYLYSENNFANLGQIMCRATYFAPNPLVENGLQKVVCDSIATGSFVDEQGDYFDPTPDPSKLAIPSFSNPNCTHIPIFMTFYPMGANGKDGMEQIDKTSFVEQLIDENYVGRDGSIKPLYGRRFRLSAQTAASAEGANVRFKTILLDTSSIVSCQGYFTRPYLSENVPDADVLTLLACDSKTDEYDTMFRLIDQPNFFGKNAVSLQVLRLNSQNGG